MIDRTEGGNVVSSLLPFLHFILFINFLFTPRRRIEPRVIVIKIKAMKESFPTTTRLVRVCAWTMKWDRRSERLSGQDNKGKLAGLNSIVKNFASVCSFGT